jgi:hypothetical protein
MITFSNTLLETYSSKQVRLRDQAMIIFLFFIILMYSVGVNKAIRSVGILEKYAYSVIFFRDHTSPILKIITSRLTTI